MTEITINPKAAAEALNVSTFDLGHQMRRAAVERLKHAASIIEDSPRDESPAQSRLEFIDEMAEEAKRLLAAAEACERDWWDDLG